jgi:hypothetical protein
MDYSKKDILLIDPSTEAVPGYLVLKDNTFDLLSTAL